LAANGHKKKKGSAMTDDERAAAEDRAASALDRLSGLVRAMTDDDAASITDEDALAALAFARAIGVILWKRSHNRRPAQPSVEYAEAYLELAGKKGKGRRAAE
jgi:hypothetical protein